jgi:hypothetical protein
VSRALTALYEPVARLVVRYRAMVVAAAAALMIATVPVFQRVGSEFMPPLDEGSLLVMPTTFVGISIEEARRAMERHVDTHEVLVLVAGHYFVERAGVLRRKVGGRGDAFHPRALDAGRMLDETANRQRAHRRRRAGLLVGESEGDREIRALVVVEEYPQGVALIADDRGLSWHCYFPSLLVCT